MTEKEAVDVSHIEGLRAAEFIDHPSVEKDEYDIIEKKAAINFDLPTHGGLKLTLSNGDVIFIFTSEWCDVHYLKMGGLLK